MNKKATTIQTTPIIILIVLIILAVIVSGLIPNSVQCPTGYHLKNITLTDEEGTLNAICTQDQTGSNNITELYIQNNITAQNDDVCFWGKQHLSHVCMDEAEGLHVGYHPEGFQSTHSVYTGGTIQQLIQGFEKQRINNTQTTIYNNLSVEGETKITGISEEGTGKVLCIKNDKNIGTCNSTTNSTGQCNCT